MRATAGECPSTTAGYAVLLWLFVLAGLTTTGILLMPRLVQPESDRSWNGEEQKLAGIKTALMDAIRIRQAIPDATSWAGFVAGATGLNTNQVQQVWPDFPNDSNSRRILLLDTSLSTANSTPSGNGSINNISSGLLPYTQNTNGLQGVQTNLMRAGARGLLISNTKRDLALPVQAGVATSAAAFSNIWNWVYNPATKTPPSGWPSSWIGNANHLHVQPINFANLFWPVTMSNVLYTVNHSSTSAIISRTERHFLAGTLIAAYRKDGSPLGRRTLNAPASFFQEEDCPWIAADIGSVSAAGTTSCGTSNLTVSGSGTGFSTSDEFHFAYQDSTGDTEIIARLTAFTATGATNREAGVMLRATTSASSDYLAVTYSGSGRVYLRYRYGGTAYSSYATYGGALPVWTRIRRVGNNFYAYYSTNGTSWTTLLSASAPGAPGFTKTGIAVSSFSDGTADSASFDSITIVQ